MLELDTLTDMRLENLKIYFAFQRYIGYRSPILYVEKKTEKKIVCVRLCCPCRNLNILFN